MSDSPERGATELWGYVDVRDAARACRLGIESEVRGFEVFNIVAADTLSETPTVDLIKTHLPDVEVRQHIKSLDSAWSTRKARDLLGYVPEHSWRDRSS